jgi:hypothetical protein
MLNAPHDTEPVKEDVDRIGTDTDPVDQFPGGGHMPKREGMLGQEGLYSPHLLKSDG